MVSRNYYLVFVRLGGEPSQLCLQLVEGSGLRQIAGMDEDISRWKVQGLVVCVGNADDGYGVFW